MSSSVGRYFQSTTSVDNPVIDFKNALVLNQLVSTLKNASVHGPTPAKAPSTSAALETHVAEIVKTALVIPEAFQSKDAKGYNSLADYMRVMKTIDVVGNTVFVIDRSVTNPVDLNKLRADIKTALAKGGGFATGAPLAQQISERSTFPLVVEITAVPNLLGQLNFAESVPKEPSEQQKPLFAQNFDLIVWNPKRGAVFQNEDGHWIGIPAWLSLFHELGHLDGLRRARNIRSSSTLKTSSFIPYAKNFLMHRNDDVSPKNKVPDEEDRVLRVVEQALAREAGIPFRQDYEEPVLYQDVKTVLDVPVKEP